MVHILSMTHSKVSILTKNPNTIDLSDNHTFQINPNYSNEFTVVLF